MGIYRRGMVYWGRWDENGRQKRQSLNTKNRRVAEARFENLTCEEEDLDESLGLTIREVLDKWLKYQTPRCKPDSVRLYKITRKRFSFVWGDLQPRDVTPLIVEKFQDTALILGLSPNTINHRLGIAMSAIKWAYDRDLIETGPPKWKRLKTNGNRTRKYLTGDEIKKLLDTVSKTRWKRLEPFIWVSLYAGLRQQEISWLTWSDIDLTDGWIHIRPKKHWSPKSNTSVRSIPIAAELARYLRSLPRTETLWVAPNKSKDRWDHSYLGRETRSLFKAAGVDDGGQFTLHRLRGVFATTVLRGGGDLESLRQVLGHSKLSVTAGYLEATSESKRRAVGSLSFQN